MTQASTTTSHPLPLQALHLPPPPSFWPFAWGWWSLLATVLVSLLLVVGLWRWHKKRQAAKKAALALLNLERATITPSGAMELLRQAALSYYPRSRIARLSGEEWLEFLDSQVKEPIFNQSVQTWLAALYQKAPEIEREPLINQCENWIQQALPPKRGGR
jgi:hypothetical protein